MSVKKFNANELLAMRLKGNLPGCSFQRVDYDAVRSKIRQSKHLGVRAATKIKTIKKQAAVHDEDQKYRLYRHVWTAELSRLNQLANQAQLEFDRAIASLGQDVVQERLENIIRKSSSTSEKNYQECSRLQLQYQDLKIKLKNGRRAQNAKLGLEHVQGAISNMRLQISTVLKRSSQLENKLMNELEGKKCIEGGSIRIPAALRSRRMQSCCDVPCDTPSPLIELDWFENFWCEEIATLFQGYYDLPLIGSIKNIFEESLQHCRDRVVDLYDSYIEIFKTPFDGWSHNDHYSFEVVMNAFQSTKFPVQLQNVIYEKLGFFNNLPCFDVLILTTQHIECETMHANQHEMETCMASARKLLVDAFEERNKQMERKAAQEYQQQQQLAVMGRLLEMKRERLQRLEAEYEKQRVIEEANRKQQIREQQRIVRHRRRIAEAVRSYQDEKQRIANIERQQIDERQRLLQELRQKQIEENAGRVQYRQNQWAEKCAEAEKRLLIKNQEDREREARLESLRELVRPKSIPDDPGRLLRPTKAMDAAAQEAKREKELRSLLPTTNVIGYDDNRITSDPRFKLAEALNRAGLKYSEYANKAMMRMKGLTKARPDAETTLYCPDNSFRPKNN